MAENQKTNLATVRFSSGIGNTLQIKFPEVVSSNDTCFCNRDFTVDDLKRIIEYVRKNDDKHFESQYTDTIQGQEVDPRHRKFHNPILKDKNNILVVQMGTEYFRLAKYEKMKYKENEIPHEKRDKYGERRDSFTKNGYNLFTLGDESFNLKGDSDAVYQKFVNELNKAFKKYDINTCIRKIHFLAQSYVETGYFLKICEPDTQQKYSGTSVYRGRGLLHLTNDIAYFKYYNYINNYNIVEAGKNGVFNNKENILKIIKDKKLDQTLKKFASEVATNWNYAVDSAGWYWADGQGKSGVIAIVKGSINPIADTDNVRNVTAKINAGLSHLNERENYTELFKKAMNYDKKKCDKNKKK